MQSISQHQHYKPQQWENFACGIQIKSQVELALASWWPRLFGYHLLKLGPLSASLSTFTCPISHHFSVYKSLKKQHDDVHASVIGDDEHLALQEKSVDAVLMAHVLEFAQNPYHTLREADRVLINGGHIVLIGFNPISPTFIGKLWPTFQTNLPWSGNFYMPSRIKDWLGLLGYQILNDERIMYQTLLSDKASNKTVSKLLEKWLPSSGSVYILIAKKLSVPMTPTKLKKQVKRRQWAPTTSVGRHKQCERDNFS